MRKIYFSDEFWAFYHQQDEAVKQKFDYVLDIVREVKILTTKFVKHLENTDLYEMRVSVGKNGFRTVLFAIDNENIILAKKIFVLNSFQKKSVKDYKKQIKIAENILQGKNDEAFR